MLRPTLPNVPFLEAWVPSKEARSCLQGICELEIEELRAVLHYGHAVLMRHDYGDRPILKFPYRARAGSATERVIPHGGR